MELRQLRYFVAIIDHSSLSRAASQLHVAQPALSQHVKHLEAELGVQLLYRSSRGISPTDAGDRLYRQAKIMLALASDLPALVSDAEANPVGEVRFGMPGTVGELIGASLIEATHTRFPGIRIRPIEAMSGHVLDWVRRGDVDIAVIYATTEPNALLSYHVLTERLCLLSAPHASEGMPPAGQPVNLATALGLHLIIPSPDHGLRMLVEEAARALKTSVSPHFEIDSYARTKQLVARGMGFGILPETAVAPEARAGLLATWPIVAPVLERRVYLAYPSKRHISAAARVVGQMVWDVIRTMVASGEWPADIAGLQADNPVSLKPL